MKNIKFLFLPFLLILGFLSLSACGLNQKESTWDRIKDSKTITIGYEADFAPLTSSQKNEKPVGFNVALAEAVFKNYDIQINWKALDWSAKEKALQEGKVDLVWGPYTADKTREKTLLFSQPYLLANAVLLVTKDSDIHNIGDMHNIAVGGQKASAVYDLFSNYPHVLKNIVKENLMVLYDKPSQGISSLMAGEIQAMLLDQKYAKTYLQEHQLQDKFNILNTPYPQKEYVVAARKKDKELINRVNKGLEEVHQSGEFSELSRQWFQP
ncbi:transporter substrate-binding domain-containing protein [Lactococcus garvieae]|uniref:ABC transporter solute-binding component n=1 Tax=Lactococcus garvieae DCC43 TaxID=1231377 RepID=K2PXS3_9LACT|nr:transporter substrate-binding domain-containing protein [Lactococcus garvieae]EKF52226.1 ABC transporter solute-binding component [Lactococcus garvieae DCC43]